MIRRQGHSLHWSDAGHRWYVVLSWRAGRDVRTWLPLVREVHFRRRDLRRDWTVLVSLSAVGLFVERIPVRMRRGPHDGAS